MLAIRMQRTGRKKHAMFRVVVQDSRLTPTSGRVVALLGSYDPHTKTNTLVKEKAEYYLNNGAQPSDRVVRLLKAEGVTLPSWVKDPADKKRAIRNPEKLRKNQPKEEATPEAAAPAADKADDASTEEA
jgi:small subunit ribosomal protein S16